MGPDERRAPRPQGNSPAKRAPEHRRRASETSVMEKERQDRRERRRDEADRPPRTESEERRRRERRREREERYKREGRDKNGRRLKPQRNLDLIDKLDVTGVYGHGCRHILSTCETVRELTEDSVPPRWPL